VKPSGAQIGSYKNHRSICVIIAKNGWIFLLGWIKHFYIPNLCYWRYEPLPAYEWLFSKTDPRDTHHRDRLFGILKETLQMECRGWPHIRGDVDRMSFWEKLNAIGTWARFPPHLLR
jgi:hypothetical protein